MISDTLSQPSGDASHPAPRPSPWHSAPEDYNNYPHDLTNELSRPIVLPQRRPGSKDRGFIKAYPPMLESYGIEQATFLRFLCVCNTAMQGHAALMAVGVAGFGVGLAPEPITMLVGAAVQFGASALNKNVARWRTNSCLEKYNNELFLPKGLKCFIGVHNPEGDGGLPVRPEGAFRSSNVSSGFPQRSSDLPHVESVAPLRYLADSTMATSADVGVPSKSTGGRRAKRAFTKLQNYLDHKAQTSYATENPDDTLTALQAPIEQRARSRPLVPTYPAAGYQSLRRMHEQKLGHLSSNTRDYDDRTRQGGREKERKIKEDILYLMIVPTGYLCANSRWEEAPAV